jgi:hypothetical protein
MGAEVSKGGTPGVAGVDHLDPDVHAFRVATAMPFVRVALEPRAQLRRRLGNCLQALQAADLHFGKPYYQPLLRLLMAPQFAEPSAKGFLLSAGGSQLRRGRRHAPDLPCSSAAECSAALTTEQWQPLRRAFAASSGCFPGHALALDHGLVRVPLHTDAIYSHSSAWKHGPGGLIVSVPHIGTRDLQRYTAHEAAFFKLRLQIAVLGVFQRLGHDSRLQRANGSGSGHLAPRAARFHLDTALFRRGTLLGEHVRPTFKGGDGRYRPH